MADFFSQHGFTLQAVHDGRGGLARALEPGYDLIILDVMLPVLNGFELLAQIRRRSSVPVIMLTARTEQEDRIAGLDAGADDYLPKHLGPEEVLARIKDAMRRAGYTGSAKSPLIEVVVLSVNSLSREVWLYDQLV